MKTEQVKLDSIKPYEKNPRYHSDLQIQEMAKSIEMFGQIRPIVIDENNTILAGHCIRLSLLHLGRDVAFVLRKNDLSEEEKVKLVLIGELEDFDVPGYDPEVLGDLLGGVDKALEEYGILPLSDNEEKQESNFFMPPQTQEEVIQQTVHQTQENETAKIKRSIACPHCGGEIEI
jgi:hypothetical protein